MKCELKQVYFVCNAKVKDKADDEKSKKFKFVYML